jgi:hypothetical protein
MRQGKYTFCLNLQGHTQTCHFVHKSLIPRSRRRSKRKHRGGYNSTLTLITSKTRLISCKQEVSIVFIISTLAIVSMTLVMIGWNLTIIFSFLQEKCLQEIQRPGTHQELPKGRKQRSARGLHQGAARELDFSSKEEPVIRTSTKKEFSQPPTFGDTEASTGSKVVLPHWGDLFNRINQEDYPDFIPHSDPDVRMLDDQVFPNI